MSTQNLPLILRHFLGARWRWHTLHGEALTRYQERRAQRIVTYVAQHSPFYREHWQGHDLHDWRTLPTVDKQLMMQNFDRFTTRGIKREQAMEIALQAERSRDFRPLLEDNITVGLSSGTSGHRGLFLANSWEQAGWAGTILARTLHSLRPRKLRVAFFLRSNNTLYEQVGGLIIQFRYFDLMLPLAEAIAQLNALQPDIIVGPPSLLHFLAEARIQGTLRIQPERLISVAEVLEPQDREYIHEAFNAPVQQIYQCTEGLLAISCAHNSLHIQEDLVALQFEPLQSEEQSSKCSRCSHCSGCSGCSQRVMPIVTDLWRMTQPIIRYRLNDVLQLETEPCPCGSSFRVIRSIEGRSDDVCFFTSQDGTPRLFYPDTIRRMILLASSSITDYQVVQEGIDNMTMRISVATNADFPQVEQAIRASVATTLQQYGCLPADVKITEGLELLQAGTKLRRVRRK